MLDSDEPAAKRACRKDSTFSYGTGKTTRSVVIGYFLPEEPATTRSRIKIKAELICGKHLASKKQAQVDAWLRDAFDALGRTAEERITMLAKCVPRVPLLGDISNLPPTPLLCTHTDGGGAENAVLFFWDIDNSVATEPSQKGMLWWMNAVDEKEYIERCLALRCNKC